MIVVSNLFSKTFDALKGHWFQAICVFFVFNLMIGVVQAIPGIGGFLSLIISGPLTVGICVYSLNIIRVLTIKNYKDNTSFGKFFHFNLEESFQEEVIQCIINSRSVLLKKIKIYNFVSIVNIFFIFLLLLI